MSPSAGGTIRRPPGAILVSAGGNVMAGVLGSWTFEDAGSDSPWLPASTLPVLSAPQDTRLVVQFESGQRIGAWVARVAAAADPAGERPIGVGGREDDAPPLNRVTLELLEPGQWVLAVQLTMADERGDATYYWLVSVA